LWLFLFFGVVCLTHHWGYVGAVVSAVLFGMWATLSKLVLVDVHPSVVAGFVYFFAGVFLGLVRFSPLRGLVMRLLKTPTVTEAKIRRKDLLVLGFVVLAGSTVAPLLFVNGLSQTTAINASLLQNAESLFTVLIAVLFLGEKARRREWVGIVLLVVGAVFLTTNAEFGQLTLTESLLGNLLVVGACFSWGIDNNLSSFLSVKEDLILITALKCLIGGAVLLILAYALGLALLIPLYAVPYLVTAGAFSIGFSILFFMLGLREIGSLRTGIIFSTSSLFGALFAFIVLREAFSLVQVLAGSIMMLGVYSLYRK
jgi:drug/metabolite transporter (DMT)-like permease